MLEIKKYSAITLKGDKITGYLCIDNDGDECLTYSPDGRNTVLVKVNPHTIMLTPEDHACIDSEISDEMWYGLTIREQKIAKLAARHLINFETEDDHTGANFLKY